VPCKGRLLCRLSHPGFASALRLPLLLGGVVNSTTLRARREGLKSHPAVVTTMFATSRSFPPAAPPAIRLSNYGARRASCLCAKQHIFGIEWRIPEAPSEPSESSRLRLKALGVAPAARNALCSYFDQHAVLAHALIAHVHPALVTEGTRCALEGVPVNVVGGR
jgi:hypothetical protein